MKYLEESLLEKLIVLCKEYKDNIGLPVLLKLLRKFLEDGWLPWNIIYSLYFYPFAF